MSDSILCLLDQCLADAAQPFCGSFGKATIAQSRLDQLVEASQVGVIFGRMNCAPKNRLKGCHVQNEGGLVQLWQPLPHMGINVSLCGTDTLFLKKASNGTLDCTGDPHRGTFNLQWFNII